MAGFTPIDYVLRDGRRVVIRHCAPAEAPRHLDFRQRLAQDSTHTLAYKGAPTSDDEISESWARAEADPDQLRLAAYHDGKLIAQLGLHPEDRTHPWVRHTARFGMGVLKEYWGQGLGRKLLELMIGFARQRGFSRIEAQVRAENARGLRLYQRAGFQLEGVRRAAALIDGTFRDEFHIALLLDERLRPAPIRLTLLPSRLAIHRLPADAAIPSWATSPGGWVLAVTRTPEELSIVCAHAQAEPGSRCEPDWVAFQVQGPLDFGLTGILARLASTLAWAGISIFAISTFDTDYILVRSQDAAAAAEALELAGHPVSR